MEVQIVYLARPSLKKNRFCLTCMSASLTSLIRKWLLPERHRKCRLKTRCLKKKNKTTSLSSKLQSRRSKRRGRRLDGEAPREDQ